jgi:hypothetical protein
MQIKGFSLEGLDMDNLGWLKYSVSWDDGDEVGLHHGIAKITPAMAAGLRRLVEMVRDDVNTLRAGKQKENV